MIVHEINKLLLPPLVFDVSFHLLNVVPSCISLFTCRADLPPTPTGTPTLDRGINTMRLDRTSLAGRKFITRIRHLLINQYGNYQMKNAAEHSRSLRRRQGRYFRGNYHCTVVQYQYYCQQPHVVVAVALDVIIIIIIIIIDITPPALLLLFLRMCW